MTQSNYCIIYTKFYPFFFIKALKERLQPLFISFLKHFLEFFWCPKYSYQIEEKKSKYETDKHKDADSTGRASFLGKLSSCNLS